MSSKNAVCFVVFLVAISTWPTVQGFNVGVKGTKCNLDESKGDINDPCRSLYDGVCAGSHCACPAGTHEDSGLKRCVPGEALPKPKVSSGGTHAAGGGGGSLVDDIPWDYEPPNKKTTPKPSAPAGPPPHQPPPGPPPHPQPGYPGQPQPGYPGQPQPGYPGQPQPGYPGQPQPGYPGQPQPGYPGQPQPGYPGQPKPGTRPGSKGSQGDDKIGEKAGGGVGGILGLLVVGGLIYYCCCRGGKHKEVMNRFQGIPFIGGRQQAVPGQAVQMQQSPPVQQDPNFGSQHTYVPPGGGAPVDPGQYPPPQQQYPPAGFVPDGQQPPPYTQQYQPNAPPPQ